MTDTIGKFCINRSDKSEIDLAISENIDNLGTKMEKMRKSRQELIESGANPDELMRRYDSQISIFKNLLVRVRNTPGCK